MTTLLFVHGTGVREKEYAATLHEIEARVSGLGRDWSVAGCYWGTTAGARLRMDGASIPTFAKTGGTRASEEEEDLALWGILYTDPLYELRLLGMRHVDEELAPDEAPSDKLLRQIREFAPSAAVAERFSDAGLADYLDPAIAMVATASELEDAALTAPDEPLEHRQAIARAIVAQAISSAEADGTPIVSGDQRDDLERSLATELGADALGVSDWLRKAAVGIASRVATPFLVGKRGAISSHAAPLAGDILRFLAYPEEVTELLRVTLDDLSGEKVYLLGHSLGGIMCVDLLVRRMTANVAGLVTVGSQAPFFYEIGALPALAPNQELPSHMPRWLNVFDRRDALSYVGRPVFPGRVTDKEVKSRQPFPQSHGAYWRNPQMWHAISDFID